jgi:hypothetical protein
LDVQSSIQSKIQKKVDFLILVEKELSAIVSPLPELSDDIGYSKSKVRIGIRHIDNTYAFKIMCTNTYFNV